jgi:hypothetical protein
MLPVSSLEKDGKGRTYPVMCPSCGVSEQMGMIQPAGLKVACLLALSESPDGRLEELEDELDSMKSTGAQTKQVQEKLAELLEAHQEVDRILATATPKLRWTPETG